MPMGMCVAIFYILVMLLGRPYLRKGAQPLLAVHWQPAPGLCFVSRVVADDVSAGVLKLACSRLESSTMLAVRLL
jgi:hypothetical protein